MDYKTYHYYDDGINDCGWGCSYRNIQTILSCYQKYYDKNTIIPTILEIVAFFKKNINCKNLTDLWIEPYDIGVFLKSYNLQFDGRNYLYVLQDADISKILKTDILIYLNNNSIINDFDIIYSLIKDHFRYYKLPVIIDNGIYSYCIVLQKDDNILLIDPHKTDDNNVVKKKIDFLKNSFWIFFFPSIQL